MDSSHGVGEEALSAVWPRGLEFGSSPYMRLLLLLLNKLYILYNILLLAEVTLARASGLGKIVTFDHFDALAFVKS